MHSKFKHADSLEKILPLNYIVRFTIGYLLLPPTFTRVRDTNITQLLQQKVKSLSQGNPFTSQYSRNRKLSVTLLKQNWCVSVVLLYVRFTSGLIASLFQVRCNRSKVLLKIILEESPVGQIFTGMHISPCIITLETWSANVPAHNNREDISKLQLAENSFHDKQSQG